METVVPTNQPATAVEVITRDHRYSGLIITSGRRLADVLSDPSLDMVELRHPLVCTAGRPTEIRCHRLLVAKRDILMAVPKGSHEAPIRRHNNYQPKHPYGVIMVLPGYVLSGIAHLPQRANPWMLVDHESGLATFFGVTDVTVHSSPRGFALSRCGTVIVHRRRIESLELSERPLPKPGPGRPAAIPGRE